MRNERCCCGFHREQVKCLCWAMWSHMTTFNIYQEMISLGWRECQTRSVNEHIWLWAGSLNQGFEILKCLEWGRLLVFTWNDDFRVTNTNICSEVTSIKTPLTTGLLIKPQPGSCLLYGSLCWCPTVSAAPHSPAERIKRGWTEKYIISFSQFIFFP